MKLIKKLFNTILILIGIAVLVGLLFFAILAISQKPIFGIQFVSDNGYQEATIGVGDTSLEQNFIGRGEKIESIVIETGMTVPQIEFNNASSEESAYIAVKFSHKISGIAKAGEEGVPKMTVLGTSASQKTIDPSSVFDKASKTLTISVVEPSGFFISKQSTLMVWLPNDLTVGNISIKVKDAKGVSINNNFGKNADRVTQINLESLTIEKSAISTNDMSIGHFSKIGNQSVPAVTVKELNLKTVSGRTYIRSQVTGDVQLESEIGTFIFQESSNAKSTIQNVTINGGSPSVEFGTISSEQKNEVRAGKLAFASETEKKEYEATTGSTIGQDNYIIISGIDIAKDLLINCDALVQVAGKIKGSVGVLKKGAELYCQSIGGALTANSGCGEIFVAGSIGQESSIGKDNETDVTVKNIYIGSVVADLKIYNSEQSVQIGRVLGGTATIRSKADLTIGSVAKVGKVDLESAKGNINVCFDNIYGINKISAKNTKSINLVVKDGIKFDLIAKALKASNIKIDFGAFSTTDGTISAVDDEGGYKKFEGSINGNTNPNLLIDLKVENGSINGSFKQ